MKLKPYATKLLLGLAALSLFGCGTQPVAGSAPAGTAEQQVMERAQARWDAARAGDFEKSYGFTAPSYRALVDLKIFRAETAGAQQLNSAEVLRVTCESDTSCAARVRIEFNVPLGANRTTPEVAETHFDEPWVKEDGNWWLFKR